MSPLGASKEGVPPKKVGSWQDPHLPLPWPSLHHLTTANCLGTPGLLPSCLLPPFASVPARNPGLPGTLVLWTHSHSFLQVDRTPTPREPLSLLYFSPQPSFLLEILSVLFTGWALFCLPHHESKLHEGRNLIALSPVFQRVLMHNWTSRDSCRIKKKRERELLNHQRMSTEMMRN